MKLKSSKTSIENISMLPFKMHVQPDVHMTWDKGSTKNVAISPDNKWIVADTEATSISIRDVASPEKLVYHIFKNAHINGTASLGIVNLKLIN